MWPRPLSIVTVLLLCSSVISGRSAAFRAPLTGPLVGPSDLTYLGAFGVPTDGFAYNSTGLTLGDPGRSLFLAGWTDSPANAEISIPDIGGRASLLQPLRNMAGQLARVGDPDTRIGGQLLYGDRLYVSAFIYYDATGVQTMSLFSRPRRLDQGAITGPQRVGALGAGFYSGYMAPVPSVWRTAIGGPAVTGNCCLSIISRTSYGPALFAFDPANPGVALPLVYYPEAHQTLGAYGTPAPNPIFNGTTRITGVVVPDNMPVALFFGSTGIGPWCYGTGADCGDPTDASKGDHAAPYRTFVWAYALADLVDVREGAKNPWDIRPYATWPLGMLDGAWNGFGTGGAAYDPSTQRIYLHQVGAEDGVNPLIHVFKLADASGSSPSGDGIAPVVSLTSPSNGSSLSGSVQLAATGSDNVGVASVSFLINGQPFGPADRIAPYTAVWDTSSVADGVYTIQAEGRDVSGNFSLSQVVSVVVKNAISGSPQRAFVGDPVGRARARTGTSSH